MKFVLCVTISLCLPEVSVLVPETCLSCFLVKRSDIRDSLGDFSLIFRAVNLDFLTFLESLVFFVPFAFEIDAVLCLSLFKLLSGAFKDFDGDVLLLLFTIGICCSLLRFVHILLDFSADFMLLCSCFWSCNFPSFAFSDSSFSILIFLGVDLVGDIIRL